MPMQIVRNLKADRNAPYKDEQRTVVSVAASERAAELLRKCPLHARTPLDSFEQLAARLGVANLFVKDETERLGLTSFKALGGAHAVMSHAANASGATFATA